jgi:hypothetical protein
MASTAGWIVLAVLLIIAIMGNYGACIVSFFKNQSKSVKTAIAVWVTLYTAALAAMISWLSLAFVWELFEVLKNKTINGNFAVEFYDKVAFTIGFLSYYSYSELRWYQEWHFWQILP